MTSTSETSTTFDLYATIIRCNCFLLYTYVTKDSFWNTGIVVANTTGDAEVFGTAGAPKQLGPITFYFYDKTAGYVGATTTTATYGPGTSFVGLLSQILPSTVTSFSGYIIAKAQFQFCHGFAFIADSTFANIAQGYLANVIPDPAIKGGSRQRSCCWRCLPTCRRVKASTTKLHSVRLRWGSSGIGATPVFYSAFVPRSRV